MNLGSSVLLILLFAQIAEARSSTPTMDRSTSKGFFSVGGYYGMGASRLLNTDSSFANYRLTGYQLDLDILLWDSGAGDIRLFGAHSVMAGSANADKSSKIESTETVVGIKFFTGKNFYLGGGMGNGRTSLKDSTASASLTYQVVKALLGFEVQVSESWFLGLELGYRNAPIKKDSNTSLTENSYVEGASAGLRLVWSPPSVTFSPSPSK